MATHTFPASYSESYFRYNQNGGSWLAPSNNTLRNIYAGRTSGGAVYRAYIYVPGQSLPSSGITISNITLNLPIGSEYSSDGRWDIGIMTSQPSQTVAYNTSGFTRIAEDQVAAENTTLTVSIPVSTWGDPTVDKYIVIVQSQARGTSYGYKGLECSSSRYPTLAFTYDYNNYYLDLNGWLDGTSSPGITGYGTADVYINGSLVANDVDDYYTAHPYGTTYQITGISATTGHTYNGVHSGSISGTIGAGNVTVNLNFTTNTYTISYNANGGSGAPAAHSYAYATSGSINLSSTKPTRTGYDFLGWSLSSSATSASYSAGQAWARSNASNYTLYAVWTPATYTNSIDHWALGFNNGEGNNSNGSAFNIGTTSFTAKYGSTITYDANRGITAPNGFYLNGYVSSSSFSGVWTGYNFPASFTQPPGNTYVEYYYSLLTHSITYNMNGGTNNSSNPSYYNVLYGVTFANPTRTGYDFSGWTNSNGTAITGINPGATPNTSSVDNFYNSLASRTIGNQTVYANWTAKTFTVTFDATGGTTPTASKTVTYNSTYGSFPTPTRAGYLFVGWFTSPSGGTQITPDTSVTITAAQTLYARWELSACVYIGNGTTWERYEVYIGNGTTWERYAPYIGNGSSWDPCG